MCHLYKIIHGFIDFPNAPLLYKPCNNYFTRYTHPLTLLQPQTRTNSFIFPFFLMLYKFGIVYHTPMFHYLILLCLRKALLNITYLYNLGTLYY